MNSAASHSFQVTGSSLGPRLLLVGAGEQVPPELSGLYLAADRDLPSITHFATASVALERLAEESFDCILVVNSSGELGQRGIDAGGFCTAARAAGNSDALLVWARSAGEELWNATCEAAAELYVGTAPWRTSLLLSLIDRAVQNRSAARENQRRLWAERQRADREREECTELLRHQRQLLNKSPADHQGSPQGSLPPELPRIYFELLRSHVMTGTTSFAAEISKLARTFALAHLTPRQVLQLHVDQVELLIKGIGQRSARHIIDRANVLCLELLLLLCECFEQENARTWWAWRRQPMSDLGLSLERRAA